MRLDVGVRAAAVLGRHHAAVCGEFVGAGAERSPQRAGEGNVETTCPARERCGLSHFRLGTEVAVVPALCGVVTTLAAEYASSTESEFARHLRDVVVIGEELVAGVDLVGHQPRVVVLGGEHIAGMQIARLDALRPRQPVGREQRTVGW